MGGEREQLLEMLEDYYQRREAENKQTEEKQDS